MAYNNLPTTDILDRGNRPGDGPLNPGGGAPVPIGREADLPSTPSEAVKKQAKALAMVRDLAAGPETVRDRATAYLPQAPGEDAVNYRDRLQRSVYFNVFGHTTKGMVGQVFRRDPVLGEDVPEPIKAHLENVDNAGTHFDVFARDLLQDAITAGHAAILVEFPQTGGTQNAAQEAQAIRPYWVPICKDNIVSWRTTTENGRLVLTQLVLKECTMVPDGMFGEVEQTRYRVFTRDNGVVAFRLYQVNKDKSVVVVEKGTYPTQKEIPIAEVTTSGRKSMFESVPMLIDLAYLNIAHYQQYSDYTNSIHKTCVPIFTTVGVQELLDGQGQPIVLGPNTTLNLPIGGSAAYVSHSGQALAEAKQALDDLKSDMGTLGLSMLSPSRRTAETAQAKRLDKSVEDSALAVTARGLQDAIERALQFHANYLRLPTGGSVSVNREFDEQTMQADMLVAWTGAVTNGGIPPRFMVDAMVAGGLMELEDGESPQDVADEMASNAQAAKDQKALEAANNLATATAMNGPNGAMPGQSASQMPMGKAA